MPETELARALHDLTPEPPVQLLPDDLVRRARRRHGVRLVGTAALPVVAVAAGLLVWSAGTGPDGPAPSTVGDPPAGASHTVTGVLENVGGPAVPLSSGGFGSGHFPFAGVVTFRSDGLTRSTTAGADGRFSIDLPDGFYVVRGGSTETSPGAATPSGDGPCRSDPVVVSGADITGVAVVCDIP